MSPRGTEIDDGTPEDVAALYAWANLTGARYRDFSAVRRVQRARLRLRAAKHSLQLELEAEAATKGDGAEIAGQRVAEARRSEAAAFAALRAIEEEREIVEAQESARRKQLAFEEAEQRRRERTGPQPGMAEKSPEAAREHFARAARGPEQRQATALTTEATSPNDPRTAVPKTRVVESARDAAIRPAWLEPAAALPEGSAMADAPAIAGIPQTARTSSAGATLLDSRAEVASRWPVLQALIAQAAAQTPAATTRMSWPRGPVVAIVSPAGGAGKTSMAAAMARALAAAGERVLLVETAPDGLLPLYFGMARLAPGDMRTAASREGQQGTISVMAIEGGGAPAEKRAQERIVESLLARAHGLGRVIIDLAPDAAWIVERLAALRPMVLAAVAPDMNSVAGLSTVERTFAAIADRDGRPLLPFYVLNRLDVALPLHLDIREVLRREIGERLLAIAVRRSAAVSEALAQGMTAVDYAPDAPVARDYTDVAAWLRSVSPASPEAFAEAGRVER
jgi:cellulose synthase operon protein YhjQ